MIQFIRNMCPYRGVWLRGVYVYRTSMNTLRNILMAYLI